MSWTAFARPREQQGRPGSAGGHGGRARPSRRVAPRALCSTLLAAALAGSLLAACGNAANRASNTGNSDGVTPSKIVVGGLASVTGPLPADFAPIFDGVRAYLNMVNADGGVNGRKIDFAYPLDDGSNPAQDVSQARALVADHVFAVVGVATPSFNGGAYLAENDVPTFGYNINPQWTDGPTLFGTEGSYVDFEHPGAEPAFLAEHVHAKAVGVISYNVTQAQQACIGVVNTLRKFHIPVVYEDLSISPPAVSLASDVTRMKAAKVDFVASCLDLAGNLVLSRTLHGAGMGSVTQYWYDGYDEAAVKANASIMNGVYLLISHVPFESGASQPHRYPEMALYLSELKKYFPRDEPTEASLNGWMSAEMFVAGLRKIGRDVTRSRLVDAINSMTSYTGGLVSPINWKISHHGLGHIDCNVFLQVRAGRFVPVFGSSKTVFTCLEYPQPSSHHVIEVPPPPDIPGA